MYAMTWLDKNKTHRRHELQPREKSWRVLVLCVLSSMMGFVAPAIFAAEKEVSYSVAVPVTKTPVNQAASSASPYKAPAPVIRPVAEAATQPVVKTTKTTKTKSAPKVEPQKAPVKAKKPEAKPKTAVKAPAGKEPASAKKANATSKKNVKEKPVVKAKSPPVAKAASATKSTTSVKVVKPSAATPVAPLAVVATTAAVATAATEVAHNSDAASLSQSVPVQVKSVPAAQTSSQPLVHHSAPVLSAVASSAASLPLVPKNHFSEESLDDLPESDLPEATPVVHKPLAVGGPQEEFVQVFKDYVEESVVPRVPGLALAIIANGQVRVLEAYGVKKAGTKDEVTTDTVFRLASVSKTIAGTTAGVLVHSGAISWDTPVTSVLPDVSFSNPKYEAQLTLGNIMSQSTGLPTHSGDNFLEDGESFDEVVDRLKKISFVCPPGKCYGYQNISFSLLSPIVKKKTGKSYEDYVKEKLFTPLGMRTASYGYDGLVGTRNYAQPHVLVGKGKWYTANITEHYYRINPAAGANASITDLSRWVLAQMGNNPDVLPPAVLNSVHDHVTKNTPSQSHYGARDGVTNTYYGMGWRMFDYRGDKHFLHHGGYVLGYRSEMVYNPELKIGMVVLSNCNRLSGEIIFRFLDAYEDIKRGPMPKKAAPAKKKKK